MTEMETRGAEILKIGHPRNQACLKLRRQPLSAEPLAFSFFFSFFFFSFVSIFFVVGLRREQLGLFFYNKGQNDVVLSLKKKPFGASKRCCFGPSGSKTASFWCTKGFFF